MKYPILMILLAFTAFGARAGAPAGEVIEKIDVPGISNFSRFEGPRTFAGSPVGFGGATQPGAMAWLHDAGFTTVISLRLAAEEGADIDNSRAAAQAAGINYINLPFDPSNPAPDLVDNFLAAVGGNLNQPVFIHCHSGTRVAALWMIGRVLKDGISIDTASEEVNLIAAKPAESSAFATAYIKSREN